MPQLDTEVSEQIYNPNDPVLVDSLTKTFGSFTAVDGLKFSIRRDEVFTLLGHNGAGKTTAIFMLTGILNPTSGDAGVDGHKISDDLEKVQ